MKDFLKDLFTFTKHDDRVDSSEPLPSKEVELETEARAQFLRLRQIGLSIPVFTV